MHKHTGLPHSGNIGAVNHVAYCGTSTEPVCAPVQSAQALYDGGVLAQVYSEMG